MSTLGEHIRKLRTGAGLSQAELGAAAGVTGSPVSQLESGLSKTLKAETLLKVASVLGVDPNQLLQRSAVASQLAYDEQQLLNLYRALPPGHKISLCG